jgi:hypothetical protein
MSTRRAGWLITAVPLTVVGVFAYVAGSSVGVLAGLVAIIGAAAILAVLVFAVTSPWMVKAVRRWLRRTPGRSEGQLDTVLRVLACSGPGFVPLLPLPQVPLPTDSELCQSWCASYRALVAAPSRRKFIRLVEERGSYLDELERRHPAAFRAWFMSDATASGNPLPYLSLADTNPPAINWDELVGGQDW